MLPAPKSRAVAPDKRMCCCTMEPLLTHWIPSSAVIDEFIFPTEGWRRTADPFIPYYLLAAFFAESEKLSQLSFVL